MNAPIDMILPLLSRVRRRQPGQYSACCPAHDDNGPSLSIRENTDGAVLLHCFAGCEVSEVVGAIGLELHDLFPPRDVPPNAPKRTARLLTPGQALDLLHDEAQFIGIVAGNIGQGVQLSEDDRQRVMQAAGRVNWLAQNSMGVHHA